jgi:putative mRNA 3-end processing factor
MSHQLVKMTDKGMYCPFGDFYIDPHQPVRTAVITHGHGDHSRPGHRQYISAKPGRGILRERLGRGIALEALNYGESISRNGVRVSLHPAGHILGSAQVRIEYGGEVWCISGDYKIDADPTCAPFEPVKCHTFITESTFGFPRFVWPDQNIVMEQINDWWRTNKKEGLTSILYSYALGKAQRILHDLDPTIGPIVCHGLVESMNQMYRLEGIPLPKTLDTLSFIDKPKPEGALLIIPPSQKYGHWLRYFRPHNTAMASGWMLNPDEAKQRQVDCGFVVSDHVDWPGILNAIKETQAENVLVIHGEGIDLVNHLNQNNLAKSRMFYQAEWK